MCLKLTWWSWHSQYTAQKILPCRSSKLSFQRLHIACTCTAISKEIRTLECSLTHKWMKRLYQVLHLNLSAMQYLIVSGIATPITSTTTTMNINKRKTRLHHFPSKLKRIPRNLKGTLKHLITPNLPSNVVLKRQSIRVDFPIPVSPKYKNILSLVTSSFSILVLVVIQP